MYGEAIMYDVWERTSLGLTSEGEGSTCSAGDMNDEVYSYASGRGVDRTGLGLGLDGSVVHPMLYSPFLHYYYHFLSCITYMVGK